MPSGLFTKLNLAFQRSTLYTQSAPLLPLRPLPKSLMAASGSKPVFGDVHIDEVPFPSVANGVDFSRPNGVFFSDRRRPGCLKASVRMVKGRCSNREFCGGSLVGGFIIGFDASRGKVGWAKRNACMASSAREVSVDGNSHEEQSLVDVNLVSGQTLTLLSGSCYLPHPDKEATGGEDAHFICTEEQTIGVADGVGGWADVGINAGEYSRELMHHSVCAIREESKGLIDPARVLEKAHSNTKAKGSSTACIIALTNQLLHAINLGDSGFIVIRDGYTIFQSPVQQHSFNFTYQLDSGGLGDSPSSGQVFTIPAASGDVIVAGTDGLFDNLYNNEVTAVVVQAVRAGLEPQITAQNIAALAHKRALDRNRQSPFSAAAQEAGFRYYGGKLDDVTVVVSYITGSTNI